MKAINAITVPGNADSRDLDRRHVSNRFDRAGVKRTNRRLQRKALRAEMSWLVASSLAAESDAALDVADDVAKAERAMSKLSAAQLKKIVADVKPKLHLLEDVQPLPTRSVTVVRKMPHRRRVVESVQVFAYPLAA